MGSHTFTLTRTWNRIKSAKWSPRMIPLNKTVHLTHLRWRRASRREGCMEERRERKCHGFQNSKWLQFNFYPLITKWQWLVRDTGRSHHHNLAHASVTCAEQREADLEQQWPSSSFVSSLHPVPQNWTIPGAVSGKRFSHNWRKVKLMSPNKHHMVT